VADRSARKAFLPEVTATHLGEQLLAKPCQVVGISSVEFVLGAQQQFTEFAIPQDVEGPPGEVSVQRVVLHGRGGNAPQLLFELLRSQQQIGVGSTVALLTNGIGVLSLYHWTPAARYDLSAANSAADHGCVPDPPASDGRLTLDRTSVRPGDTVIGVLSDFRQWPHGLVGGGSGETFKVCTPWQPYRDYPVLGHDTAALFLIHVPAGLKAGGYPVSVRFFKDATSSSDIGFHVGLTTTLTVTTNPPAPIGVSPACALHHAAAPFGALSAPMSVPAGGSLRVAVTGVGRIFPLGESQRLYFVACLAGQATPVVYPRDPGPSFTVPVPPGLRPGSYDLVVTGVAAANPESEAAILSWHRTVTITETPVLPATGTPVWSAIAAAAALMAAGGWLQLVASRRCSRPRLDVALRGWDGRSSRR
jgi:hypothetical protein